MTTTPRRRSTRTRPPAPEQTGEATGDPAGDLALLRRFEPVVRYTRGELFFPSPVEPYLARTDLLVGRSERERSVRLQVGSVSPGVLARHTAPPGENLYLRLVQEPMDSIELARWQMRSDRDRFRAPGRLARVGLFARLVDAGFTVSLLLRGSVPGGTAAAAHVKYLDALGDDPRVLYHARVVRRNGWIVLHYLYFYFMNDYRSTFGGANDQRPTGSRCSSISMTRPMAPGPSGSPRLPTTTRATTCDAAGTTRTWCSRASTRSSSRAVARTRRTSSRASTSRSCRCRSPGAPGVRSTRSGRSGGTPSTSPTRETSRSVSRVL